MLLVSVNAQKYANFVVQSDDSIKFMLEIDNVLQFDSACNNIKVTDIKDQSHTVRLTIIGNDSQKVEKALFFQSMGVESTMKLVDLDGEFKLRYFGEVSMGAAPLSDNQKVVVWKSNPNKFVSNQPSSNEMSKVEAYSYEFQNSTDFTFSGESSVVYSNTTSSVSENVVVSVTNDSLILDSLSPLLDTNKVYSPEVLELVYNYSGEKGCSFPDFEVNDLLRSINESPFSSQKMKLARNGVREKCLTTVQVEKIARTLEFEDDKLSFIKYAYQFTYDKRNYRSLLKLFNFESTKSDFIAFLEI